MAIEARRQDTVMQILEKSKDTSLLDYVLDVAMNHVRHIKWRNEVRSSSSAFTLDPRNCRQNAKRTEKPRLFRHLHLSSPSQRRRLGRQRPRQSHKQRRRRNRHMHTIVLIRRVT